jgi:hypothetical protein
MALRALYPACAQCIAQPQFRVDDALTAANPLPFSRSGARSAKSGAVGTFCRLRQAAAGFGGSCAVGVDSDIFSSSSVMSAGTSANSGVER